MMAGADASTAPPAPPASQSAAALEQQGVALSLEAALELGYNRALRGDDSVLQQVLGADAEWRGPLGNYRGAAAIAEELGGIGRFLQNPRITFLEPPPVPTTARGSEQTGAAGETVLEWIASATWPLPWLPRCILRGRSAVRTTAPGASLSPAAVTAVSDTWDASLPSLAVRQLLPGFWDLWHQLCSPPAEQYPYQTLAARKGYEVRLCPPRLCVQASIVDRTNERRKRMAVLLPDFVFSADLRTSGRNPDSYATTSPVEASVTPVVEAVSVLAGGPYLNGTERTQEKQRRANRITWTLQAPTAFGLEASALGECDGGASGEEGDTIRVVRQGWRLIAVAPFNGRPQDKEAAAARQNLLERLGHDGVATVTGDDGRPRWGMLQHDGKAGWTRDGQICIGIWEHRPKWIGNGNEIYVDLLIEKWKQ